MHEDMSQTHSLVALLKACGKQRDLRKGRELHDDILRLGLLEKDVFIGSALVSMYAKCSSLARAKEVFDELPVRNVVSWNALITGYAQYGLLAKAQEMFDQLMIRNLVSWNALIAGYEQHGYGVEALTCFERMPVEGILPNSVTYLCILKACGSIGAGEKGQELHAKIVEEGLLGNDYLVGTALVDMYARCGLLAKAQDVFDKLPVQTVVSWNVLIAGYANHGLLAKAQEVFDKLPVCDVISCNVLIAGYVQHGHGEKALKCFEWMQLKGLSPNKATFVCALKACGSIGAATKGQEIHDELLREGLLEKHIIITTALIDMYAKCGVLGKAQEEFNKLPIRDAVLWSALIAGYGQHGHGEEAINCYEQMQHDGFSPDAVTFVCILKACGSVRATDKGRKIHAEIVEGGFLEKHMVLGTALVDMYAKCGLLSKAREVFDELKIRDVILWNVLMTGYAQHGHGKEALSCFKQMQLDGLSPNAATIVCILNACASIGAADKGQELHAKIVTDGLLDEGVLVGNALIDMYAKCGLLAKAAVLFDTIPVRDVVSWNALISGFALLGMVENVFYLFYQMIEEGLKPDLITFTSVINACSHTGLLDMAQIYFESMSMDYGVTSTLELHTCMVDLFSRAGHLDKAVAVIEEMPFSATSTVWHTILGACRKWGNVKLGRLAFEHAMQLDEMDAAAYVCMSNIYTDAGRQAEADKVEALRVTKKAWDID